MGLDIRIPIGFMFILLGGLLTVYGLITWGDDMYARHSLGIDINLWWGLVMTGFGAWILGLASRGKPTMRPTESSPEGRALEEAERRRGLEH